MLKFRRRFGYGEEINPDDIFLDATNLPQFDTQQFEGRIERPISKLAIGGLFASCFFLFALLAWKTSTLQIERGEAFLLRSESNNLRHTPLFAERGLIYDRTGAILAWNGPEYRQYIRSEGFAHVLGYTGAPNEEELDSYHPEERVGRSGAEQSFNERLRGENGLRLVETNAYGEEVSGGVYEPAVPGRNLSLSIDAGVQEKLHATIRELAAERDFVGGAAMIMDIHSGEVLAMTSYPEFDPEVLTAANDTKKIQQYTSDARKPFLNRAIAGVYTPGSIVKPFIAIGALAEGVATPDTRITSTGSISIPNPFDPGNETRFTDWRAHGSVAMRDAIAVSSNVYFYELGGGYKSQKGIGIRGIEKYMRLFGLGEPTGVPLSGEAAGVIPSPEWKALNFEDGTWRIGDTYHTAIGQFGFGVTVAQMARAAAAIATGGKLVTPRILAGAPEQALKDESGALHAADDDPIRVSSIAIPEEHFTVIREGMRQAVTRGTASGLSGLSVRVAAKTGTAELGETKQRVNSWVIGFFPYESPRYAFAVVMERGSRKNTIGGVFVMRQLFEWMQTYAPEYLR